MQTLKDKVAIITGGGTGIGRGIALALAQESVRVVICGRRQYPLDETVSAIQEAGGEALAVQADVSDPEDVDRLVRTTLERYGQIDILVNNAGIYIDAGKHGPDIETWEQVIGVNLSGPFLATRAVLPGMRKQRIPRKMLYINR